MRLVAWSRCFRLPRGAGSTTARATRSGGSWSAAWPRTGGTGEECLYRWDEQGVTTLDDDLTLSNGLAWSADATILYSIDSTPGIVWQRRYDVATGDLRQPRVSCCASPTASRTGCAVDAHGNLWIAVWGAGEVRCYRPDGELVSTVTVAAPHTSSVAFVGPGLDLLLITTARHDLTDRQLAERPNSGRLFLADVGVCGLPVPEWVAPPSVPLRRRA